MIIKDNFNLIYDLKPTIPILGIKKRTSGTAILAICRAGMLKVDGLSQNSE